MRPLTDSVAKPALIVGDRPLGAYGLQLLSELRGRIAVNLSWLADSARIALEPYAPPNTLWFIESPEPYGTAGTVAALLADLADTFVVFNADLLTDLRLTDLMVTHGRMAAPATVAVQHVGSGADLEVHDGRATRFVDRRIHQHAPGAVYIGAAALERDRIAHLLEPGKIAGLGEAVIKPLADCGELAVHGHGGYAIDVGTSAQLAKARRMVGGG